MSTKIDVGALTVGGASAATSFVDKLDSLSIEKRQLRRRFENRYWKIKNVNFVEKGVQGVSLMFGFFCFLQIFENYKIVKAFVRHKSFVREIISSFCNMNLQKVQFLLARISIIHQPTSLSKILARLLLYLFDPNKEIFLYSH